MKIYLTVVDNNQSINNIEVNPKNIDSIIDMLIKCKNSYNSTPDVITDSLLSIKYNIMPKNIRVFAEMTYSTVLKITSNHSRQEFESLDYSYRNEIVRTYSLTLIKEMANKNVSSAQVIRDCISKHVSLKTTEYYSILTNDMLSNSKNIQIFNSILNKNYAKYKTREHVEIKYLEEARDMTAELIKNWR